MNEYLCVVFSFLGYLMNGAFLYFFPFSNSNDHTDVRYIFGGIVNTNLFMFRATPILFFSNDKNLCMTTGFISLSSNSNIHLGLGFVKRFFIIVNSDIILFSTFFYLTISNSDVTKIIISSPPLVNLSSFRAVTCIIFILFSCTALYQKFLFISLISTVLL